jgi:hypothetical protein
MRKLRNALIAGLAGAAMLIAAIPAQGDHSGNEYVETTDRGPGAHATFSHLEGEYYELTACDDDKDGFGVRAYASLYQEGTQNLVRNTEGEDTCVDGRVRVQDRHLIFHDVWVGVCLRDHDGDRSQGPQDPISDRWCSWEVAEFLR